MRITIKKQLFFAFGVVLCIEVMIVAFGIMSLRKSSNIADKSMVISVKAENFYEMLLDFEHFLMPLNDYCTHGSQDEKEIFKAEKEKLFTRIAKVKKIFGSQAAEFIPIIDKHMYEILNAAEKLLAVNNPVGSIEAGSLMERVDSLVKEISEELEEYHEYALDAEIDNLKHSGQAVIRESLIIFIVFSCLSISIFIIIGYLLFRSIQESIRKFAQACDNLFSDKSILEKEVDLKRNDEFGDLSHTFNKMALELKLRETALNSANKELSEWGGVLEKRVNQKMQELININQEMDKKIKDLERFHRITVDRELQMKELKKENQTLKVKLREASDAE